MTHLKKKNKYPLQSENKLNLVFSNILVRKNIFLLSQTVPASIQTENNCWSCSNVNGMKKNLWTYFEQCRKCIILKMCNALKNFKYNKYINFSDFVKIEQTIKIFVMKAFMIFM